MNVVLNDAGDAELLREASDLVRSSAFLAPGALPNLHAKTLLMAAFRSIAVDEAREARAARRIQREFTERSVRIQAEKAKLPKVRRKPQIAVPDEALAAVIGPEPGAKGELIARVWSYIRENGLHRDKRVYPDATLRPLFARPIAPFGVAARVFKRMKFPKSGGE